MPERFAGKAYLHEEADAEFVEASRRYDAEASEEVGAAFEAEVERAVAFIVEHAEASPASLGNVRRKVLLRFPYSLFYAVEKDRIRILAVAHHKRRPGYWAHRL